MTRSFLRPGWLAVLAAGLFAAGCAGTAPRAFVAGPLPTPLRVAVLPLANYTDRNDASDRVVPILTVELAGQRGLEIVDQGRVEEILAREPWLMMDRVPPDLLARFGKELSADAFLLGSVLAYGHREGPEGSVPEFSIALRLVKADDGTCLWSGTHSRAGTDRESVFGLGREESLERLVGGTIRELVATFPETAPGPGRSDHSMTQEHP